jgi:hypothetical protein
MTSSLFNEFLNFFTRFVLGRISLTNNHLLILDGHGNHVTLEVIKQAHKFGLDMVTLPTHTFRALQPFDVSCFKTFKTTFRKEKDVALSKNNYMEPDKITLVGWVNQALDKSIMKQNIIFGFKVTGIYFLNLKAMDNKTRPSNIYITIANEHEMEEEESNE